MSATAEKTTPVQQQRVEELQDENGWPRIYTYPVQGKTIVGEFRRYVTREDAACIGRALYDFLMMVCGFIAEYGLVRQTADFAPNGRSPQSSSRNWQTEAPAPAAGASVASTATG